MVHIVYQFKEASDGAWKTKLADIIKHHQMGLQVAEICLNENLKRAD